MKRWSEGETVKFVELYRDYECLWDTTKTCYRNNQMRQAALEKIVTEMNIDGFTTAEARQKIKSLRNTYSQELNKIEKCLKSGMAAEDVYTPSVKWFKIMDQFMRKTNEKRCTESNMETQASEATQDFLETEVDSGTIETEKNVACQQPPTTPSSTPTVPTNPKSLKRPSRNLLSGSKRRRTDLCSAVEELRQMNQSLLQTDSEASDEFETFGQYIALGLKKLPINLALECQEQLQSTLTRYRLMALAPQSQPLSVNYHQFGETPSPASAVSEISFISDTNIETSPGCSSPHQMILL